MAATVTGAWAKPGAWALDSEEQEAKLLLLQPKEETPDFPSLAAVTSVKTTKKKKSQAIPLSEFAKPALTVGLTSEELMMLPTGPRQRTPDELDLSRISGYGFKSPLSRADGNDDWGSRKKLVSGNGFERSERGGFLGGSESRADASDSWVSKKSFVPLEERRYDTEKERKGFGLHSNGGADSDNWMKKKEEEGRKGGFDCGSWGKKREEGSGWERPRLKLQPRTLPVSDGQQNDPVTTEKAKGSRNPFGETRPREEVLKEKGLDWKEIDGKLESMKIKEMGSAMDGGKRNFGRDNGRRSSPDERSWRKMAIPAESRSPTPSIEQ